MTVSQRKLSIERAGSRVIITIRCSDDYDAIALYDSATEGLNKAGTLELRIDGATRADDDRALRKHP